MAGEVPISDSQLVAACVACLPARLCSSIEADRQTMKQEPVSFQKMCKNKHSKVQARMSSEKYCVAILLNLITLLQKKHNAPELSES